MYNVIDLFAGAGGLSLGFTQTGKFNIKVAVENNPNASATYELNNSSTIMKSDVRELQYLEILKKCEKIDVIIGGPPCQGFSNANRQKNTIVSNNNRLVKEFIRAILEVRPKVFVMENVGMLKSDIHRFFYSLDDADVIDSLGLIMKTEKIRLLPSDVGISNLRRIIDNQSSYLKCKWQKKDYGIINQLFKSLNKADGKFAEKYDKYKKELSRICESFIVKGRKKNIIECINNDLHIAIKYYDYCRSQKAKDKLEKVLYKAIYIQGLLNKLQELKDNQIIVDKWNYTDGINIFVRSYAVSDYIIAMIEKKAKYSIWNGVINAAWYGVPQKRERYIVIGTNLENLGNLIMPEVVYENENDYATVKDAIEDLSNIKPTTNSADNVLKVDLEATGKLSILRDSDELHNHIMTETRDVALERFAVLKPGQNFHDLDDTLKTSYEDATRTQNTIYMRLNYNQPSGTVVNVRKSMWVHPTEDRALSIREAARLQSFPDSFKFKGTKDSQYQQVGNAVPPMMANAIAKQVLKILEDNI